ncbi:bifunctional diaminohydroxyphosphoribosylaminopyrimidine deaminase/5-amino-6-(5-phosphoribosylamino)uracil reductase RibD [Rhodoplanes sp. Z2-YC6860]|uniref:bifunctional diaminohydroxyphosphoribosylaminopyrimidine deaminase/5-amino-6-(5-phosphoribosylamino)uracil reductase RibD n=1 Tax=Rhodoplanes sp. Z2-YC6860 TaxID=674703 RepID=UPI00078CC9D2|nr:bifunctional diaminohydroxyphosphoribosylaminopyrimidine deaminase/5-amino-6-(5-phosphoribosylamino)uracil reductase RibD [Rhodoplanes sp. Z2-YC6860]AMN42183.1 riboflavin biosynthesis protein [Rhodoplanes sp. Z2-YC6860]
MTSAAETPAVATAAASSDDWRFMQLALALGRRGLGRTWPNPAVGAVVVKDGVIVGRGWTQPGGRPHAETEALKRAGRDAKGATMYVTLEPCSHHGKTPPCADAIIRAGVARVVSALEDVNPQVAGQGYAKLRERGIVVDTGLGREEARHDHAGHSRRMRDGRPHVLLKLAASSDGKAGLPGRKPVAITGEAARQRVHLMRAEADAILVGIGTVLADDPHLTCRLPGMFELSPVRVVLDAKLRIPLSTAIVGTARDVPVWVFGATGASPIAEDILKAKGVEVFRVDATDGRLDLHQVVKALAERGITRLMVEGGPIVAASFLAADLVDEAALFRSPNEIGPTGIDVLEGMPLGALTQSAQLTRVATEAVGDDTLTKYERA